MTVNNVRHISVCFNHQFPGSPGLAGSPPQVSNDTSVDYSRGIFYIPDALPDSDTAVKATWCKKWTLNTVYNTHTPVQWPSFQANLGYLGLSLSIHHPTMSFLNHRRSRRDGGEGRGVEGKYIFIAHQHPAADARYWYSNSVRPSVRLWHAGIVWKIKNGWTYRHSFSNLR